MRPPGDELAIGADQLIFSTTDDRGIIRSGNSVFVHFSGYSETELAGAPHSLVRHPDMPGGVFALMWDRLRQGRPMAGYVKNLAKDGRSYSVLATITPVQDGFLSVRMAPLTEFHPAARRLYETVRADEYLARKGGLSRAEAAAEGSRALEEGLRALGFAGYDDFMTEALPAEVAARAGLVANRFWRTGTGGPVATILTGAQNLTAQLDYLVGELDDYRNLSRALQESSRSMLTAASQLELAALAARDGSALIADRAPVLDNVAKVMVGPCQETVGVMRSVVSEIDRLRALIAQARFQIALARLHADMVAAFAREVLDGSAPSRSLAEVPVLCDALRDGVQDVAGTVEAVNLTLASVAEAVGVAGELFSSVRKFVGEWRRLVLRRMAGTEMAAYVGPIDQMLADGHGQLSGLNTLAQLCQRELLSFDPSTLDALLASIRYAAVRV